MDKPKILVVEDEPETLTFIKQCIERVVECEVHLSGSGEDALDKIKNNEFDLVILDIKMPGLSGLDVMRMAKKEKKLPDTLVITGWDSAQVLGEVIKEGALDYMPKPIISAALKEKIKDILEKKGKYFEKTELPPQN